MGGIRICRRVAALGMLVCAAALLVICAAPRTALASDYSCPEVTINADIQSDGSLRVVELRSFDFNDTSLVWWGIRYDFEVHDVQFGTVQENGEIQFASLSQTMFNTAWRQGNTPETLAWSHDIENGFLYVFFPKTTGKAVIRIDYTMPDGVSAYKDCSELYWSYVSNAWPVDSNNVTCTITLPVPAGITPEIGNTVYAWGHGPENGTFAFNLAGTAITYHDERVPAWSYADARIVFPRGWLANLSPEQIAATGNSNYFSSILYQEEAWADDYHWRQWWQSVILLVSCGIGIVIVGAALVLWYVRGRDHEPEFTDEFWMSEPAEDLHPCMVSKLRAFSFENDARDAMTALLHLVNKGAVRISRTDALVEQADDQQTGLMLTRQSDPSIELDTIDRATLVLFFDELGDSHTAVSLDEVIGCLQERSQAFRIALGTWRRTLDSEMQQYDLFDEAGNAWQKRLALLACGLFLPGLLLLVLDGPALMGLYALVMLPVAIALFAISSLMPRLTRKGTEIMARAEALRRWLTAFANNAQKGCANENEQQTCNEQYWKRMALYAFMFNINTPVIEHLRSTCPHLFAPAEVDADNLPWWTLYEEFALYTNTTDDDQGDERA